MGVAGKAKIPTEPVLRVPVGFVYVTAAVAVSWFTATPLGAVQPPQAPTITGTFVPVTSTTVEVLLPLFATTAKPSRGMTATPSGVVPTRIGGPIRPIGPSDWGDSALIGARDMRESVPSLAFVATARSRSVSTATPTGALPTEI